jgi:hypothetical protein
LHGEKNKSPQRVQKTSDVLTWIKRGWRCGTCLTPTKWVVADEHADDVSESPVVVERRRGSEPSVAVRSARLKDVVHAEGNKTI